VRNPALIRADHAKKFFFDQLDARMRRMTCIFGLATVSPFGGAQALGGAQNSKGQVTNNIHG